MISSEISRVKAGASSISLSVFRTNTAARRACVTRLRAPAVILRGSIASAMAKGRVAEKWERCDVLGKWLGKERGSFS
jgi:hypothetical protein